MASRIAALVLTIPALAFCAQRVEVTTTEKADFAPGGTVRIEHSVGELNIEGWDQPTVQIEAVRYTFSDHPEQAKALLAKVGIMKELKGTELTISTAHKRYTWAHVDYRIHVPRNTNLVVRHGIGDVTIYDVSGNIDADARTGDVVVQLPEPAKYQIDARAGFGSIYSDFDGVRHSHLPHLKTNETLKIATEGTGEARQIHLHVSRGGVTIEKAAPLPLLSSK